MSAGIRLSRPISTAAALFSLWFLGVLGFTALLRLTGPWLFLRTQDAGQWAAMLGSLYGARVGALLPSVAVASVLIGCGRFRRPYVAVFSIVAGYHMLNVVLRWMLRPPAWSEVTEFGLLLPLTFEALSVLLLAGFGALILYVHRLFGRRAEERDSEAFRETRRVSS